MDRVAWWAAVHGALKSQTGLSRQNTAQHDVSYKVSKQPQWGTYHCFILQVVKLSLNEGKWYVQRCTVRQQRGLGLTPRQPLQPPESISSSAPSRNLGPQTPQLLPCMTTHRRVKKKKRSWCATKQKKKKKKKSCFSSHLPTLPPSS